MSNTASALVIVAALAAPAFAHGGGYGGKPPGGGDGPQAGPGFGEPSGPVTRWESWWQENREDLLRVAEHADAAKDVAVTPGNDGPARPATPEERRAALAAAVRDDVLSQLLWALREDDFDVRSSAAIALGKTGDARAVEPLKETARHDERGEVRRAALLALGILGRREQVPFLCDAVADRKLDVDERSMAALAAGLLGGDDAASFLSFFMERDTTRPDLKSSAEAQLAGSVYAGLGLTGSMEALRTLWRAADDEALDPVLRAHAVLALGRLRDHDSTDRCVRLLAPGVDQQLRRAAVVAVGRVAAPEDAAAVRALTGLLSSERDPAARRFAIAALGGIRCTAARGVLRDRFDVAGPLDKAAIAVALAMQRDAASAPAIRAALKAEHEESSLAAYCTALGLLADRESIPALEHHVGPGPTPGTYRGFAAIALAVMPSPDSCDVIWKRLPEEKDARVWGDYCIALGVLGDGRVRGFLDQRLKGSEQVFDRCRAASCLGVLRRADALPELTGILHDRLQPGIVRALCVVAMGQIADPSIVPKLSRLAAGGDSSLATRALAEALTIL
jgi:HEAT repeat protein